MLQRSWLAGAIACRKCRLKLLESGFKLALSGPAGLQEEQPYEQKITALARQIQLLERLRRRRQH